MFIIAATVELVIPGVAAQIQELKVQRALVVNEVEAMVNAHPLTQALTSMLGGGIKTAATILLTAGDLSSFPTPATWLPTLESHRSLVVPAPSFVANSTYDPGNKHLKNVCFDLPGWASCHDPTSKAYYDRKRAEG